MGLSCVPEGIRPPRGAVRLRRGCSAPRVSHGRAFFLSAVWSAFTCWRLVFPLVRAACFYTKGFSILCCIFCRCFSSLLFAFNLS